MRDVLVALQGTLNEFATQIDENTDRIDRMDQRLRRIEHYLSQQK